MSHLHHPKVLKIVGQKRVEQTRAAYTETLGRLVDVAGEDFPVVALTPEIYGEAMRWWEGAAAGTWNRHLSALTSFTAWANRNLERLRSYPDIGREELIRFFTLTSKDLVFVDNQGRGGGRGPAARLGLVILSPQVSVHDVHDLG